MQTKVLIVAVIKKGDAILMRKKPEGSPPYKETWYIFGAELVPGLDIEETLQQHVKRQAGITLKIAENFSWDTEVKNDLDGIKKQFVYLDVICDYVSGSIEHGPEIEKLEWVNIADLASYDLVPPSVELFKKLGYLP